ncbi:MAG TPA: MarR family transcriptional regulator [Anaerolineaceae bacterium]|jgi:DNA-binding MarR family transcriptional regulator|nr:MarR family transcriptional regulator [Chloroflexota bacterium]HPL81305.1 MarR family transcriptional regulator [Anaerolineaceae bacterium]
MSLELSNALHAWADLATRQSMENNRQYMHERGYSFAQMNSLFFIHHHERGNINDLASHLGISKAAASQMINRLVDLGLVNRLEDPQDRRIKLLTLTEEGQALIRGNRVARHAWIDAFCAYLGEKDTAPIADALETLVEHLKAYKEYLEEKKSEE